MEAPSPRYILTRAVFLIALLVACLFTATASSRRYAAPGRHHRRTQVHHQRQLVFPTVLRRGRAQVAGPRRSASSPRPTPSECLRTSRSTAAWASSRSSSQTTSEPDEPPAREKIIRNCLRGNYENFLKLGYTADFHTLDAMQEGDLPPIPVRPARRPQAGNRQPDRRLDLTRHGKSHRQSRNPPAPAEDHKPTDIEIAAAKQLARDLAGAQIIEEPVRDRILAGLAPPPPAPAPEP